MEWDYERDNIHAMKKSDVMVSDFSGIIFDYTFLCDKPVMYVNAEMDLRPYDAYDIDGGKNIWQFAVLKKIGIELTEEQFADIGAALRNAADSGALAAARAEAKSTAWMFRGEAGKRIVDFMVAKGGK